jgi:hypothetical protein
MSAALARIMQAAKSATPDSKGKYGDLLPIVRLLLDRDFTVQSAVEWMIAQKTPGVTAKNAKQVADALRARLRRKTSQQPTARHEKCHLNCSA